MIKNVIDLHVKIHDWQLFQRKIKIMTFDSWSVKYGLKELG